MATGVGICVPPLKGIKFRLIRKGDALLISTREKGTTEEDGSEEVGGEDDVGRTVMVNRVSTAPIMPTDSAKIRRDREEENNTIETPSKKSKYAGKNGVPETAPDVGVLIGQGEGYPDATKSKMEVISERGFQHTSGGGENKLEGTNPSAELAKADGGESAQAAPSKTPESATRPEVATQEIYRIPSYAGWFEWGKIHPVERKAMSEFFDTRAASKTPRIYKEYRDFIINKYRENPKRALTFTEVRRMLIGDVNSLGRVFDFLEHWGLINHQVSSEQVASEAPSPSPTVVDSYPSGINVVTLPVINHTKAPNLAVLETSGKSIAANNFATHKNIYSNQTPGVDSMAGSKKPEDDPKCFSCKGNCARHRFVRKQQLGISLCPDCFKNGKFPSGTSSKDFMQVPEGNSHRGTGKEWTSKETLLLLEAVSRFGENWSQVAAHVPTRSKLECVKQFIQLPFGDNYHVEPEEPRASHIVTESVQGKALGVVSVSREEESAISSQLLPNTTIDSVITSGATQGSEATAEAYDYVSPFTDTSHPLFSQVALLSGMVGPRVAAAAAQAAVAAIAEDEPGVSDLQFVQSSKISSSYKDNTSRTSQNHTDSLVEGNDKLLADVEGPSHEEKPGSQSVPLLPNYHDSSKVSTGMEDVPSAVQARASVATALGVAAANAKLLADQEEREIEHLVANIIDNQMKKLYAKLEHFEELEMLLEKERLELERARQQVYADRLRYAEGQTATAKSFLRNPAPS